MAPLLKGKTQPTQPLELAATLEDQPIFLYEADLLTNYEGSGTLSIESLSADRGVITSDPSNKGFKFTPENNYNGTVTLTYVVKDDNGWTNGSNIFEIKPVNDAPKKTGTQFTFPEIINDSSLTFTSAQLLQGFTDIDGDTLSVSDLVANEDKGVLSQTGTSWTYTPEKNQTGIITLNYLVYDGKGGEINASKLFKVVQSNNKPALTGEKAILKTGREDASYTLRKADLLEGFSDADGDNLTVVEMEASNGKVSENSDGSWTFNPNSDYFGTVDINYRINDGNSNSIAASNSFSLKNVNDAPSLTGERAELDSTTVNQVVELKSSDFLAGFTDADKDLLSISRLKANNGKIEAINNTSWTLTPEENFTGVITLSYDVMDPYGRTSKANQSFKVLNNLPKLTGSAADLDDGKVNKTIFVKSSDLLKGYTDLDGHSLFINDLKANNGTVKNINDKTWSLTPKNDFTGTAKLSYDVSDGNGGITAATQSVEILSFNNAPLKSGGTASFKQSNSNFKARTSESSAILIRSRDLLKGYSDPDGDQLSISGLQTSGGSLEQKDNDTWLFTPDRESSTLIEFSYTIEDSEGASLFVSNTIFNEKERGSRQSGTKRRDILSGTQGDDELTGLKGHDKISGLRGNDVLHGGDGKDQLKGGQGDDELIGGKGKDRLWGDSGSDLFIVKGGTGYDVIADFDPNDDLIQVSEGLREIEITSRKGDALIYKDDDLIAKVKGLGESLSMARDFVM
ncbi:cadherin-like domain-containing protein [Synechococcus sp. CC9616]|uniref:cadherin-like domain-containing protein n=1 Tax=Synechococcus sp. CC9616 TaxID=110663 RepID=UPI00048D670B|nr:cadherin-like domain-containing protein [Synechococcus sp. CC9616]